MLYDDILMRSDGVFLTGLWFINTKDKLLYVENCKQEYLSIFECTCKWLDIYFSGVNPNFIPMYKIINVSDFTNQVIDIMKTLKFGETMTYKDIANIIIEKMNIENMSCQAVGDAVGKNPISIIIPCHRVIGKNGNLTGYTGGMKNKIALLKNEGIYDIKEICNE